MKTTEMFAAHPRKLTMDITAITECINSLVECADVCTSCADACLGEQMVQDLTKCISLNLDCADICQTTARILARQTDPVPQLLRTQLESCAVACRLCMQECEVHSEMHQHCRICRASCQNCEKICQDLISRLSEGTRTTFL
ncbi:four-helix bundle copper-binding protein [Geomonas propionica]|uniref:Four-helix bundle copper-binding protein n=1 Tax=Geomonas propionica TaxID=2798582 RepID=A0ABS0YTQ9_9BACT|nr:four-helix bundle copper-binding protein [Geomonas propionica]MBJ6801318.1 four-helix bundle copper-binding protein [Geomonas propionica]